VRADHVGYRTIVPLAASRTYHPFGERMTSPSSGATFSEGEVAIRPLAVEEVPLPAPFLCVG